MKNKYLYSRLVYSMAYVCAVAILVFSYLWIPNDLLVAFAIACLVAGGYLNTGAKPNGQHAPKEKLTTLDDEMAEAKKLADAE